MAEELRLFNPDDIGRRRHVVYRGPAMSRRLPGIEVAVFEAAPDDVIQVSAGHVALAADGGIPPEEAGSWDGRKW